jgi:signal transduction histidine kinase/ligand-binding sensor domain-containing protein
VLPRFLAWLWLMCAGLALGAQSLAWRPFDHRDGLPESQIRCLMEDRDGFLWVGSDNALARLGSGGFQAFSGAQGFGSREIHAIFQDRTGAIWAAGSGLSELRGSRISNYGPDQGLTVNDRIYALAEGGAGDLFVGTRLGLFHRSGAGFEQVKLPGNWLYTPIYSLAADGSGGLWLGSRQGLLAHWDGRNLVPRPLPEGFQAQSVRQLQGGPGGRLRVLCAHGLLRLEQDVWRIETLPGLPAGCQLSRFREDATGGLVICLGVDGIYLRDPAGRGQLLTHRDGLSRQQMMDALRDRQGTLWVGSDGSGLAALPEPSLRVLAYQRDTGMDLGLGMVLHFLELPGDRMLMATFSGLVLWDERTGTVRRWDTRDGLPANELWTLEDDGRGGAWLGSAKGIAHWSGGRIQPGPPALKEAAVNQFLRHQGRLWAATTLGVAELDLDGRFISLSPPPQEVGGTNISEMLPRPWGLLVGTQLGPYSFGQGQYKKAYSGSPVAKEEITTLNEDGQGQLWLGTLHGLFGLVGPVNRRQWQALGGRLQNGTSWVRALPSGGLAVGHAKGVTLLPPNGDRVELTRNLGLLSDETSQDAAYLDHRGRLWVGMVGGVNILTDLDRQEHPPLPPPRVLEARWGRDSAWLPTALRLPPNPSNLTLAFDLPLPCAAQPPHFQTRIDGLSPEWTGHDGSGQSVQIAHLGPGSYTFRVRASLDGSTWVESAPLAMVVGRAWHQTWAARLGLVLILAGLLAFAIQLRFRSLKHQAVQLELRITERTQELALRNRSLERVHHQLKQNMEGRIHFVNAVTHDLRSPLTSILLGVDRLRSIGEAGREGVLGLLERESRRMEGLLKGLLDQSRAEAQASAWDARLCHPSEILEGLTETFQIKAQARDLRPELDLDPASSGCWVLADATALQQVLFNLVENALKFTTAPGAVGIRSRVAADSWVLEVWDQGRGIEPDKLEMIFLPFAQTRSGDVSLGWGLGLSICKGIVEGHSGRIEVESEPGRGSRFRVTIPLVK